MLYIIFAAKFTKQYTNFKISKNPQGVEDAQYKIQDLNLVQIPEIKQQVDAMNNILNAFMKKTTTNFESHDNQRETQISRNKIELELMQAEFGAVKKRVSQLSNAQESETAEFQVRPFAN